MLIMMDDEGYSQMGGVGGAASKYLGTVPVPTGNYWYDDYDGHSQRGDVGGAAVKVGT